MSSVAGDGDYPRRRAALELRLLELGRAGGLAVAFSGGVDSSVLLHAAHAALGAGAVGVIADSPSLPRRELREAVDLARSLGARLEVVRTREGEDPRYQANAGDRCYFCKAALFDAMQAVAQREGLAHLAFGEITDDARDLRPGAVAARERGVVAPLVEAGFSKQDVRRYAREAGLPVAQKPASACLASRIPVGRRVTRAELAQVEAAEEGLRGLGLSELRVRHHGTQARVEVGAQELGGARAQRTAIEAVLAGAGLTLASLEAYLPPAERSGPGSAGDHAPGLDSGGPTVDEGSGAMRPPHASDRLPALPSSL